MKSNFWDNPNASEISLEYERTKKTVESVESLKQELIDIKELFEMYSKESTEVDREIEESLIDLENKITPMEIETLLCGEYDTYNCYMDIHPGAGGTEAQDWAYMLLDMYKKFCDKNNYKYEVIDYQDGEEAGIKSVTLLIKGPYAYGYFKSESGVHRLVRISPFDSNSRRHTSFASVAITPEFKDTKNVVIDEKDIKIDVYHSSGAGGQSVNTTDSAVRITHIPTKIVVTCQNERSQLKNKEQAFSILKNKLFQLEIIKEQEKLSAIKGEVLGIDFGSQIRSYTLEPYTLVKDNRTNFENANAAKVLNGDIIEFMIAYLKQN